MKTRSKVDAMSLKRVIKECVVELVRCELLPVKKELSEYAVIVKKEPEIKGETIVKEEFEWDSQCEANDEIEWDNEDNVSDEYNDHKYHNVKHEVLELGQTIVASTLNLKQETTETTPRNMINKYRRPNSNAAQANLTCDECNANFKNETALNLHFETEYECVCCNLKFPCKYSFALHNVKHLKLQRAKKELPVKKTQKKVTKNKRSHKKVQRPFSCSKCKRNFTSRITFERHTYAHKIESLIIFRCTVCNKRCSDKKSFDNHIKKHNVLVVDVNFTN